MENRESHRARHRIKYLRNRDQTLAKMKIYRRENAAKRVLYNYNYRRAAKLAAFNKMGGKCVHCGFSNEWASQVDHINGNGYQERLYGSTGRNYATLYGAISRCVDAAAVAAIGYQLLCANCNWIKRHEREEHTLARKLALGAATGLSRVE